MRPHAQSFAMHIMLTITTIFLVNDVSSYPMGLVSISRGYHAIVGYDLHCASVDKIQAFGMIYNNIIIMSNA